MSGNLCTLAYVSRATTPFTDEDLTNLLSLSRNKNELRGITGMLLYCSGSFFQIIEGPQLAIDQLYDTLLGDKRHCDIRRLIYRDAQARAFSKWSMAFKHFDGAAAVSVDGFSEFLDNGTVEIAENRPELMAMINMFVSLFDDHHKPVR
ncbi:BLUF domain-containing protein [Simiduia aestuariiviva]|uniref:BLUF domain-containing protein n=1 Tax=Simiduia aestuariiviva TaxID=1510459 RepID=A0A839UQB4_9GAMM|nr:BLUF domain-containing protein [Simiduia aestuariiviva]MBB3167555.1 hypothetical protein [Simiduia aestuariiviva]